MSEINDIAAHIPQQAALLLDGARDESHGSKDRLMYATAEMWTAYLMGRPNAGAGICQADACVMMALHKIARISAGMPVEDHFVDACGYIGMAWAFAEPRREDPELDRVEF